LGGVGGEVNLRVVKVLFWNENDVDLSASGGPSSIKITPGEVPYLAGEVGVDVAWLSASVFAETLKFSKSDEVDIGAGVSSAAGPGPIILPVW
ncbi:MAG: hypothetical protein AAB215_03210, partial [Planctomycetota bacterium]